MKYLFLSSVLLVALAACNTNTATNTDDHKKRTPEERRARMDSLRNDLLNTDIAFSRMSEDRGRNIAFLEYADEQATLLRPFSMPVTRRDTIADLFKHHPDTAYTLTWMPISADVARSGDMGYTYGTYTLDRKGKEKSAGTYCTVWKKDKNQQWKFILDTGNEGLKK